MSLRVIGYEGEGRHRRPIHDDEGAALDRLHLHSWGNTSGMVGGDLVRGEPGRQEIQRAHQRKYTARLRAEAAQP